MARFQTLNELASNFGTRDVVLEVADPGVPLLTYDADNSMSPASVWRTQPAVRTVVDFIASNVASIPLHVYRRTDGGRERDYESGVAKMLAMPSVAREQTPYRFWKNILTDWLLWDRAAVMVDKGNHQLVRIPPKKFRFLMSPLGTVDGIVMYDSVGNAITYDPSEFLILSGYSDSQSAGISPVETLRGVLAETADALAFRRMMWQRQATHTGVVERDSSWDSPESRKHFLEGLRAFDAKSERSGGTMLLDEGMTWKDRKPSFTPSDLQDIEARKLTIVEVCSIYHIAPEMVGARQGNYSNMEAFRQSLYRDNLGPYIDGWEQSVKPLVSDLQVSEDYYIEAFLDAKLRGSFEEQAQMFQTSVGAPVMTRNEARRKMNLPDVDGGDDLVTPLNVLVGGQSSPTDTGVQNERAAKSATGFSVKSPEFTPTWEPKARELLDRFLVRQCASVVAQVNAKSDIDFWDEKRWNDELTGELHSLAFSVNEDVGREAAERLGLSPDAYSAARASAYLRKVSNSRAEWINRKTRESVEAAVRNDEPVEDVFSEVRVKRGRVAADAFVAAVAGWSVVEASRQLVEGAGYKQWIVTSANPRASHAALNGERVAINGVFSSGQKWPGDPVAGVDEVAGCMCGVEFEMNP